MAQSLPTTKDVAKLAGVSPATVSYVLNGRRNGEGVISEATSKRVLDAMAELGYVPNQAGRNLRKQRTERICLALPQLGLPYHNILAHDLQKMADQYGYSLIIALGDTAERKQQVLAQLQSRLADGAVITLDDMTGAELKPLLKVNLPFVVFSNTLKAQGFDVVRTNEAQASYEGLQYLVEKGHRRIAFLGHFHTNPAHYERYESYRQILQDYGIDLDLQIILGGADIREEAYLNTKKMLQLENKPDAIFAASDIAAISAIWAVRDFGLRVPEDVAVMGVGNIAESELTIPPLTTIGPVSLDFTEVANRLFNRLKEPSQEGYMHLLRWQLLKRGSA